MQMSNQQPKELPFFASKRDCPFPSTLVQAAVCIFIGRWSRLWWLKNGGSTPVLSSDFAISLRWTLGLNVHLILLRYYALREPTTAKTD
jgi:hypothetical protein